MTTKTKRSLSGTPRKLTDAQVLKLRAWKPLRELCRDLGITVGHGSRVRRGYYHKQVSP